MKREAAIAFKNYVYEARDVLEKIISKEFVLLSELAEIKLNYTVEKFEELSLAFKVEVRENYQNYLDFELIKSNFRVLFSEKNNSIVNKFISDVDIIKGDFEVEYLLKMKKKLLESLNFFDVLGQHEKILGPRRLMLYLESLLEEPHVIEEPTEPVVETRFDFDILLSGVACLGTTTEQMQLVHNRLSDFKQWQLQHDIWEDDFIDGKHYVYTKRLYPKFEQLCQSELTRLKGLMEIEKEAATLKAIAQNPMTIEAPDKASPYIWKAKDADLVELVAALNQAGAIQRTDGEPITRKELMEFFCDCFNKPIKDPEGKLVKVCDREKVTAYLDKLADALCCYNADKVAVQEKRKSRGTVRV